MSRGRSMSRGRWMSKDLLTLSGPVPGYGLRLCLLAAVMAPMSVEGQAGALRSIRVERTWIPNVILVASASTSDGRIPEDRARVRALADEVAGGIMGAGGAVDIVYAEDVPLLIVTITPDQADRARDLLRSALLTTPSSPPPAALVRAEQRKQDFVAGSPRDAFRSAWEESLAGNGTHRQTSQDPWVWVEMVQKTAPASGAEAVAPPQPARPPGAQDRTAPQATESIQRTDSLASHGAPSDAPVLPPYTSETVHAEVVTTWIGDAYSLPQAHYQDRQSLALAMGLLLEERRDRSLYEHASSVDVEGRIRVWVSVDPESAATWERTMERLLPDFLDMDPTARSGLARQLRTRWTSSVGVPRSGALAAARALLAGRSDAEAMSVASGILPQGGPLISAQRAARQVSKRSRLIYGPPS